MRICAAVDYGFEGTVKTTKKTNEEVIKSRIKDQTTIEALASMSPHSLHPSTLKIKRIDALFDSSLVS